MQLKVFTYYDYIKGIHSVRRNFVSGLAEESTKYNLILTKDDKKEKQFVAINIHLENGEMYISYSGTDDSLVGWKEDFNLSFMTHIPAQSEALKYIRRVSKNSEGKR